MRDFIEWIKVAACGICYNSVFCYAFFGGFIIFLIAFGIYCAVNGV